MKRKITLEMESTASLECAVLWEIAREEKILEVIRNQKGCNKIEKEIFEDGIRELKEIAVQIERCKWNI